MEDASRQAVTDLCRATRSGLDLVYEAQLQIHPHLYSALEENIDCLYWLTGRSLDAKVHRLQLERANGTGLPAAVFFLDGLVDGDKLERLLDRMNETALTGGAITNEALGGWIRRVVATGETDQTAAFDDLFGSLTEGQAVVLVDGVRQAHTIAMAGWKHRQVSEPQNEQVIRGPRDGFIEHMQTNLALLRRRLRDPNLRIEGRELGTRTRTAVAVVFLKDVANAQTVAEVNRRLQGMQIDQVLETNFIQELVEENPLSPFPQVVVTERPDKVASAVLEGKIAIFADGTPHVILLPAVFWDMLQSVEDKYDRVYVSTALRLLRVVAFIGALIAPASYVALTTFNQEMIPSELALLIASSREQVPFPAVVEALIMEFSFEVLREAGVRMPRPVGQAITIVGVLIIGQAAVEAGIVSPPMVIVVSITALATFVIPVFSMAIGVRLLRFPMLFLAAAFGGFGIVVGLTLIWVHIVALRSFGVPYYAPMAPTWLDSIKSQFLRLPFWTLRHRPGYIHPKKTDIKVKRAPVNPERDAGDAL